MKTLLCFLAFAALALDSCSPSITPVSPTTLNLVAKTRNQTSAFGGILKTTSDTNIYAYALSCGCSFRLKVENADSSAIHYYTNDFKDTVGGHYIRATPFSGLTSGKTYTGYLAIATIQPLTTELLRDTLRDTVVVK
jgi:hypothetical protein